MSAKLFAIWIYLRATKPEAAAQQSTDTQWALLSRQME
jgi:hypothetical protein